MSRLGEDHRSELARAGVMAFHSAIDNSRQPSRRRSGTMLRLGLLAVVVSGCGTATPAVVTPAPTAAPTAVPEGAGLITFGGNYDESSLEITAPDTTFKTSSTKIAWSAYLREPARATTLTLVIARKRSSGTLEVVVREEVDVPNPDYEVLVDREDLARMVDRRRGAYLMRYVRGTAILAEGEFTLVK